MFNCLINFNVLSLFCSPLFLADGYVTVKYKTRRGILIQNFYCTSMYFQ